MLDKNNLPKHIAIIMDGNGRWARQRNLPRVAGHRQGIERAKEIIAAAAKLKIEVVTFFAFSAENWSRPKNEISMLMRYLNNFLDYEISKFKKNNIRLVVIGREEPIPKQLQNKLKDAESDTKNNTGLTVILALNYGGRQEIVDAAKKFAASVIRGDSRVEDLDEEGFGRYLYTGGLPDPDLFIRTSGEMRISNFMLWQLSYAELYFSKKYWPDFASSDLEEAILDYQKRERRFGRIDVKKDN
jgi:undecaprenyl diphosphate synthase